MKKYIHKKTGVIGELKEDCHVHFKRCSGNVCSLESIHMDFVVESNDWEEINKEESFEEEYSPYCKLCSSCGENGCCPYLICINNVLDSNKGCNYPNGTKFEIYLRDIFMERVLLSNLNQETINQIYSDSYDEAINLIK